MAGLKCNRRSPRSWALAGFLALVISLLSQAATVSAADQGVGGFSHTVDIDFEFNIRKDGGFKEIPHVFEKPQGPSTSITIPLNPLILPLPQLPTLSLPELPKPELPSIPVPQLPKLPFPQFPTILLSQLPKFPFPQFPNISLPQFPNFPVPQLPTIPFPKLPVLPIPQPTFPKPEVILPEIPVPQIPSIPKPVLPNFPLPQFPFFYIPIPQLTIPFFKFWSPQYRLYNFTIPAKVISIPEPVFSSVSLPPLPQVSLPKLPSLPEFEQNLPEISLPQIPKPELPNVPLPRFPYLNFWIPQFRNYSSTFILSLLPRKFLIVSEPVWPPVTFPPLPQVSLPKLPSLPEFEQNLPEISLPQIPKPELPNVPLPQFPDLKFWIPQFRNYSSTFILSLLPRKFLNVPEPIWPSGSLPPLPQISLPKLPSLPEFEQNLPEISLPQFPTIPKSELPNIPLPRFYLSQLTFPYFKFWSPQFSNYSFSLPQVPQPQFPSFSLSSFPGFSLLLRAPSAFSSLKPQVTVSPPLQLGRKNPAEKVTISNVIYPRISWYSVRPFFFLPPITLPQLTIPGFQGFQVPAITIPAQVIPPVAPKTLEYPPVNLGGVTIPAIPIITEGTFPTVTIDVKIGEAPTKSVEESDKN